MKKNNSIIVIVKVIVNAANESIEYTPGYIKVKVSESPFKGKANRRLLAMLADKFEIQPSDIKILKGKRASVKFVKLSGLKKDDYEFLYNEYKRSN